MAIYHLHAKVISRATGRSAVAAAAYRSASELPDERLDRAHDFTNKAGVIHSEVLLPEGSDAPTRLLDRAMLWNAVERIEVRKDAQLAREIEFSIPREMPREEGIRLAQDFVKEQFVARGMVADLNVHWDMGPDGAPKPHAHVMLATRAVGPEGFGKKVRDWNRTELLLDWRERWSSLANERLAELGLDLTIDHRSYAAQGIALEPQNKIGPAGARREDRGEQAERVAEHAAIARRNGERIIAEPERVLAAITRQQSTFTRQDLARFVDRHTADAAQFATAMAVVEASPDIVRVGIDGRGRARFSTREMLGVEERLEAASYDLARRDGHGVRESVRERALAAAERTLQGEQLAAFQHVTGDADLSVVVGYAGAGKSTMLGTARAAWEASGYRVRGAALSGIAAEGLEGGAGIQSRTLASLEHGWAQGRDLLSAGDVLVVDEAGMVGSRQMERVLFAARDAGAKVVLVGDPEQLQAIEAGAAFRAVAERVGAMEITEIHRQREGGQQAATRELATGRTAAALERYEAAGMVREHATLDEARTGLVAEWNAARQQSSAASQIMLAHRRVDVRALNDQARALRQEAGELGADHRLPTGRGERDFAEGDRIYFLKNERSLGVKNGTLATIERITGEGLGAALVVRLDGANGAGTGRAVSFELKDYAEIDHGYAATVHKSQGVTVDRAHVLATQGMDRHTAYVGLSRHRDGVTLHWSRDEMGSREGLDTRLGRERLKDTSLDYPQAARTNTERETRSDSADVERRFAYAERRGLIPESEIVLRERAVEATRQVEVQPAEVQPAEARPAEATWDEEDSLRAKVRAAHARREARPVEVQPAEAAEKKANAERPERKRGMFDGLKLGAGRGTGQGHTPVPAAPEGLPRDQDALARAVDRYARAWTDAWRMKEQDLPLLEHQTAALHDAGAALDGAKPGALRDLSAALRYEPAAYDAMTKMQGLSRTDLLLTSLAHEDRVRREPELKAGRLVKMWNGLEAEHTELRGWEHAEARGKVEDQMKGIAGALKRDPQLEALVRGRQHELGIADGSRLDRVLREQNIDRAIDHSVARHRGLGLSR
jgi:Ti-type conjugative transfer relaxase TraA